MTAHTIPPEPRRTRGAYKGRCVSIDDATDAILKSKAVGDGCRSRGIRELVRYWLRGEQEDKP